MSELASVWVVCSYCGTANLFSQQFCSNCDAKLDLSTAIETTEQREARKTHERLALLRERELTKIRESMEWYSGEYSIIEHDMFGMGISTFEVVYPDKALAEYREFVPVEELRQRNKTRQRKTHVKNIEQSIFSVIMAVIFVLVGVSVGPSVVNFLPTEPPLNSTYIDPPLPEIFYTLRSYVPMFYYLSLVLAVVLLIHHATKNVGRMLR